MIKTLLIGIVAVVLLMLGWFVVQSMWGKIFSDYVVDDDVMAGRTKCSNCGCTDACELKRKQFSENIN